MKNLATAAAIVICSTVTSEAVNIAISGINQANNQKIIDFYATSFVGANVTFGDYSNPANIPQGTDVFVVSRMLGSAAYDNATNSTTFNNLTIPVIAMTSYVARTAGNRWAWHSGGVSAGIGPSVAGDEITLTAAGEALFGTTGPANWWVSAANSVGGVGGSLNNTGVGTVGGGTILATAGDGGLVAVKWAAGQASAGGAVFGGPRLLFNISDVDANNQSLGAALPDTEAGLAALRLAIADTTGMTVIPEPSGSILLIGSLGLLAFRRRRSA
jgi:hypothetical protein